MGIQMNVKGVLKAVGVTALLMAGVAAGVTVIGMLVDMALPGKGYGGSFKGLFYASH